MPTNPESDQVIKRLVQLTQEGRIEWKRHLASGPLTEGTEDFVETVYTTTYNGHHLRLYQARYKHYTDEDRWSWDTTNRLETVDRNDIFLWRFPSSRWTYELHQAVIYQTAGVDKMFKDILTDTGE